MRDALHFFGRLAKHLAKFHRLPFRRSIARRRKAVRQRLAVKEDATEQLGNVVVQFEGHPPALGFLHLHDAVRQGPQQFFGPPGLRQVRHHQAEACAVETLLGQGTDGNLHRYRRTVAGIQQDLDLGTGVVGRAQEGRIVAWSAAERKRPKELPVTCSSGHLTMRAKHWLA